MRKLYLLLFLLLFIACDAPRNNPLDAGGNAYRAPNMVILTVSHQNSPSSTIDGVVLIEPNLNLWGQSNQQGQVSWRFDDSPDSLTIQTQSAIYFPKKVRIKTVFPTTNYQISLNAVPQISVDSLTSIFNNVNGSSEIYFRSTVSDFDGREDLKQVRLFSPGLWSGDLRWKSNSDIFSIDADIHAIDPSLTPESLVELPFHLSLINQNGDSLHFGNYHVRRVITTQIVPLTPVSQSVQRDTVLFSWEAIQLNYDFTLEIDIYAVITNQFVRIAKIDALSGSTTRYMLDNPNTLQLLSSFNNFWQLNIRDNQGNICRSTPVFFTYER